MRLEKRLFERFLKGVKEWLPSYYDSIVDTATIDDVGYKMGFDKEPAYIFDFELTKEEMTVVDSLDRGMFLNYNPYGQQQGFFRRVRNNEEFKNWNDTHPTNFFIDIVDQIRYRFSI